MNHQHYSFTLPPPLLSLSLPLELNQSLSLSAPAYNFCCALHDTQIMESLGGDRSWFDRFVAEHSAIAYYWLLIAFYLISPKVAYNFMQRVELHAMDTYAVFVEANSDLLKTLPPPKVALEYYLNSDLYLFDEFQQSGGKGKPKRRPQCDDLFDVFSNIRDDESEHVKTMSACQSNTIAIDIAAAKK